jgi:hypothetical protein
MTNPNLYIIDDGTLDTVVACAACDWEGRYNDPKPTYGFDDDGKAYTLTEMDDRRINVALEMAEHDHDCGPELDGPLNGGSGYADDS